jgi:hypothetical protein
MGLPVLVRLRDTSSRGILRTLRSTKDLLGSTEGSKSAFGNSFIGVQGVIAGLVDVLPAERKDVLKRRMLCGPFEIDRVLKRYCRGFG